MLTVKRGIMVSKVKGFIRFLSRQSILINGSTGTIYTLETNTGVCSCQSYRNRGTCRHAGEFYAYRNNIPQGWRERSIRPHPKGLEIEMEQGNRKLTIYFDKFGYKPQANSDEYYPSISALILSRVPCN